MQTPRIVGLMFTLAFNVPFISHANVFITGGPYALSSEPSDKKASPENTALQKKLAFRPLRFTHNVKHIVQNKPKQEELIVKKPQPQRMALRAVVIATNSSFSDSNKSNFNIKSASNHVNKVLLQEAIQDVDMLNTTIRIDASQERLPLPLHIDRTSKDAKGLVALTPAKPISAAVVTPVQVAVNESSAVGEMAWTSMPMARDLPPQVANLAESFIQSVLKQLPSSKKIRNNMPFDEFVLRIKEAIDSSPDVAVVSNLAEQSKSNKSLAFSSLLPQVNATADTGKRHTGRDPYLGTQAYDKDGTNLGITVSQLVFDFGSAYFGLRAGKARQKAAEELLVSKKSEQALKSINAFIELERARELHQLASENANSRLELTRLVKERFALGGGTKPDVIRAESRYAEALSNVALASSRVSAAQAAYREMFDSNPDTVLLGPDHDFVIEGLNKSAEELAGTYPGLLQLARLKDATTQESKAAIAKALPSFNLVYSNTSSGYTANNITPSASSSVLLQMSIPIYSGGADKARKQDAKLKALQSELEFQAAMRAFEKSLQQSQAEVMNSEDILAARAVSVRSAISSMRAVREQFAFNKGSLLDVISMQDSLYQAGRDMIDAQADRNLARYRLAHLTSELQKLFQLSDQPLLVKD